MRMNYALRCQCYGNDCKPSGRILVLMMSGISFPVRMQNRWCRAWSMPNLTDFVHIFSKRGYLQCVFVHWRDLKTKSKSTAYLLENWNSSTTAPDALFSPWWASTASSHRLCCSSWSCFRCAAALSACTLPAYPRLENHPFRRTRASDVGAALPCLRPGFPILASRQSRRQIEASTQSRSEFADPRYRPRGRITKSVTVTTTYNRTILSGTAASAQYKMAKAALHLNTNFETEFLHTVFTRRSV